MSRKSLTVLLSCVVVLAAGRAFAQGGGGGRQGGGGGRQGGAPAPLAPITPLPRVTIEGVGGVTFEHAAGGVFGGGVGYAPSKYVEVLVEAGRMTNVLPKATVANLDAVASSFVANGTTPFVYAAKRPGIYGLGALRITTGMSRSGLQPFIEGGAGLAHVTSKVSARSAGVDETSAFLAAIAPLPSQTRAMLTVGAGLSVRAGKRAVVDLGYRYGLIFTDAPRIPTNRFYAAFRVGM